MAFEDHLHDLRKYSFSFLTALLTAESILIPGPSTIVGTVPDLVKLTVMLVTLLLVICVRLLERRYELFEEAGAMRARIIENSLNLSLTELISVSADRLGKGYQYVHRVYYLFELGIVLLSLSILPIYYFGVVAIAAVVAGNYLRDLNKRRLAQHFVEWSTDR